MVDLVTSDKSLRGNSLSTAELVKLPGPQRGNASELWGCRKATSLNAMPIFDVFNQALQKIKYFHVACETDWWEGNANRLESTLLFFLFPFTPSPHSLFGSNSSGALYTFLLFPLRRMDTWQGKTPQCFRNSSVEGTSDLLGQRCFALAELESGS